MPLTFNRRHLMAGAASLAGLWASGARAADLSTIPTAPFVEAKTTAGRVRGGTARGALSFKGLPYAGLVSGSGRFIPPPPVAPWKGVRDALSLGAPTLQREKQTYGEHEPAYSEDCLFLNVWTPAVDHKARPVMVYLHGGGYSTGSAGSPTQDGGRLAAKYDVVVVAPNHRLGLLGFLWLGDELGGDYNASGNQGMFDMIAALKWVRDNIAHFGGDPGNVTIFGESGGGAKIGTLMGMPEAKGLFHKSGISSGAQLKRMPRAAAAETTRRLMKALDITDARKLIDAPAQALLDLQWAGEKGQGGLAVVTDGYVPEAVTDISFSESTVAGHFGPVVDGICLPKDPFDPQVSPLCADVPLLIGNNRTEASFFLIGQPDVFSLDEEGLSARLDHDFPGRAAEIQSVYRGLYPSVSPTELYLLITTAKTMGFETVVAADRKSVQPAPVYRYRWDYASNRPIAGTTATLGAGHATDIGPMFDNWDEPGLHGDGEGVQQASDNLSQAWVSFARTGAPSVPGVDWPAYDTATRPVMLVDAACSVVNDPDGAARAMWTKLGLA